MAREILRPPPHPYGFAPAQKTPSHRHQRKPIPFQPRKNRHRILRHPIPHKQKQLKPPLPPTKKIPMKQFLTTLLLSANLALFPTRAQEPPRFLVCAGSCETTTPDNYPKGFPALLKLDTQTGQSWILIRLHQFPYSYYWEKVADKKSPK